jgi:pimeloyl-ACP methyl ester carboxylesterase
MSTGIPHTEPAIAQANGIAICYDTFGDPRAPAMLLISGHGCSMMDWDDDLCAQLAARGYCVIRYDNRDTGRSASFAAAAAADPAAAPYTLRDMADDGAGLLDALGIRSAHVVGISMGGFIAQVLAVRHPERVRTLVSIMSSTRKPGLPGPRPEVLQLRRVPTSDRQKYIDDFIRWEQAVNGPRFMRGSAYLRAMAEKKWAWGEVPEGGIRQSQAIATTPPWRDDLRGVSCPALVIHGGADPLVPVEGGIDTAGAIPGAKLLVIPEWGHGYPAPSLWPQLIDAIAGHCL